MSERDELIIKILIAIIMELLLVWGVMYVYNNWLAIPLELPIVTYVQMLLIRFIFSFLSRKLIYIA